jgi:hypothetical protein
MSNTSDWSPQSEVNLNALGAVPKFQAFWHSLSQEEQHVLYDVMVAMRGPDPSALSPKEDQPIFAVKMATTAKIRALLLDLKEDEIQGAGGSLESSHEKAGGYYINRQTSALSDEDKTKLRQDLKSVPVHFVNHMCAAFKHFFWVREDDKYFQDVYKILLSR